MCVRRTCSSRHVEAREQSWVSRNLQGSQELHFGCEDLCPLMGSLWIPFLWSLTFVFTLFTIGNFFMVSTSPHLLLFSLPWHYIFSPFLLFTLACSYINFLIFWSMVTAEIIVEFLYIFISCTVWCCSYNCLFGQTVTVGTEPLHISYAERSQTTGNKGL